jgi:meso-butanediol dehydrogenase / (S,S)-butanediol dehydrogenase / diacetyl reductase
MTDLRFAGKVGVVTGGASGIGEAAVRCLHAEGAFVVVGDIDTEGAARLESELGERVASVRCDVTEEGDIERLIGTAVERFGQLDLAFNVAGGGPGGQIVDLQGPAWRSTIDAYLTGVFFGVKHEARQMIAQDNGGAILNVSSICAQLPLAGSSAYCCAKAGVAMLTKVAALELGEYGIRVNAVSPGRIATPATKEADAAPAMKEAWLRRTPLARLGQPDDVAAALLFLASDDAKHVSGADLVVDGGFSTTHFASVFRRSDQEPNANA